MVNFIIKKVSHFQKDNDLVSDLNSLTEASYIDNRAILEREINHCSEIYLLYNQEKLIAFFMVNFEKVGDLDTFYLGLSAVDSFSKNRGNAKLLYFSFFDDCRKMEEKLNKSILCWFTTITPIAYYWFNKNCLFTEPDLNGNISSNGKILLTEIAIKKYKNVPINVDYPFILKSVSTNTEYSQEEKARLKLISERHNIPAFNKFNLNENEGDRFLMICYVPKSKT